MNSPVWVYLVGLLGMALYGSRIVVQWFLSEKAGKVVNPPSYWVMSSVGAVVLYIYGWLRKDFSIIFGESVSYYIYMWNISVMGMYRKLPRVVPWIQGLFPLVLRYGVMGRGIDRIVFEIPFDFSRYRIEFRDAVYLVSEKLDADRFLRI